MRMTQHNPACDLPFAPELMAKGRLGACGEADRGCYTLSVAAATAKCALHAPPHTLLAKPSQGVAPSPKRWTARIGLVLGMLLLATGGLPADTLKVRGIDYKNVKVIGMREGRLYYRTNTGDERNVALEDLQDIQLDAYPEFQAAKQAFDKGDFASAAKTFTTLSGKVKEDYLKILVEANLVVALDRSGQFLPAAQRYVQLLKVDNGPITQSARPGKFPADPPQRSAAAEKLSELLKSTADPIAKKFLQETVEALKSDAPAPAPTTEGAPKTGLLQTADEAKQDPLELMIRGGKAEAALKAVDEQIAGEGGSISKLLYLRGLALASLGRDNDALLAFMRVVVHFTSSSSAYYGKSLTEAGKLLKKQNKTDQARKLWEEARGLYEDESDEAKALDGLLAGLK